MCCPLGLSQWPPDCPHHRCPSYPIVPRVLIEYLLPDIAMWSSENVSNPRSLSFYYGEDDGSVVGSLPKLNVCVLSGHLMFTFCRMHLLIKTWIRYLLCLFQSLGPIKKNEFDVGLKYPQFGLQTDVPKDQTCLAFLILSQMSSSAPLVVVTMLPRS